MDFDDLLAHVGSFGRYQKIVLLLVLFPATLPCGFFSWNQVKPSNISLSFSFKFLQEMNNVVWLGRIIMKIRLRLHSSKNVKSRIDTLLLDKKVKIKKNNFSVLFRHKKCVNSMYRTWTIVCKAWTIETEKTLIMLRNCQRSRYVCMDNCFLQGQMFMSGMPHEYHCTLPLSNLTLEETLSLLPKEAEYGGKQAHDKCRMYSLNYSDPDAVERLRNVVLANATAGLEVVPCMYGWEYNRSDWASSIVTEWNLVCDKRLYVTHAYTISSAGSLFSVFFLGFVADR